MRVQDAADRRQNRIYPTDAAKRMGEPVQKELLRFDEVLTKEISQQDLETAFSVLLKMRENLSDLQCGEIPKKYREGSE